MDPKSRHVRRLLRVAIEHMPLPLELQDMIWNASYPMPVAHCHRCNMLLIEETRLGRWISDAHYTIRHGFFICLLCDN